MPVFLTSMGWWLAVPQFQETSFRGSDGTLREDPTFLRTKRPVVVPVQWIGKENVGQEMLEDTEHPWKCGKKLEHPWKCWKNMNVEEAYFHIEVQLCVQFNHATSIDWIKINWRRTGTIGTGQGPRHIWHHGYGQVANPEKKNDEVVTIGHNRVDLCISSILTFQ